MIVCFLFGGGFLNFFYYSHGSPSQIVGLSVNYSVVWFRFMNKWNNFGCAGLHKVTCTTVIKSTSAGLLHWTLQGFSSEDIGKSQSKSEMIKRDEQVCMETELERKGFQTPSFVEKVCTNMPEWYRCRQIPQEPLVCYLTCSDVNLPWQKMK